jgi:hypothetical protein
MLNISKLNKIEDKERCHVEIPNMFADLKNFDDEVDIVDFGKLIENTNILTKERNT